MDQSRVKIPQHLAVIMDGNGRWAQKKGHPRMYGHVKGTRVAKKIITECSRLGIKHLTLYAFSTENWMRPDSEVSFLMRILKKYLKRETENLIKENIRFSTIGELDRVPADVALEIDRAKEATSKCTGLHLIFALSYGSRQEITQAVQNIVAQVQAGHLSLADIDESVVHHNLQTTTPDPDLIVRTSGEQRISNFLLWQSAYSELYFTSTLWPDFTKEDLHQALLNYTQRDRRYGRVNSTDESLTN